MIITDFDTSICSAVEQVLNSGTTHLLCQWHMLLNLKKHFNFLTRSKSPGAKLLYSHIMDAIFCD